MTTCLNVPASVEPNAARFYALAWHPAAWMHEAWWRALALDAWQPVYCATPHCRRWIDRTIVTRRGFPEATTPYSLASLTPLEWRVLSISERLPTLLLALGLLRLAQPEYWMLKPYFEAVQPYLDAMACSQLNIFSAACAPAGFHARKALVAPEQLVEVAWSYGAAALAGALSNDTHRVSNALRALEILFMPGIFNDTLFNRTAAVFGLEMLFRLARFL